MKFHDELNPALFNGNELKAEVKDKLKEIADAFIEYLEIDKDAVEDVRIYGSSVSYNYTKYSDLDLHLVVDYDKIHEDCPIVEGYLWAFKAEFNKNHDISIYGVPVEVYAEKTGTEAISNGVYSLTEDKWLKEPEKIEPTDNDAAVEAKFNELKEAINRCDDSEVAQELQDKIYAMRKAGLDEVGEFSTENLAFKALRNAGCLDKLKELKKQKVDKELSLESYNESIKEFYYVIDDYDFAEGPFNTKEEANRFIINYCNKHNKDTDIFQIITDEQFEELDEEFDKNENQYLSLNDYAEGTLEPEMQEWLEDTTDAFKELQYLFQTNGFKIYAIYPDNTIQSGYLICKMYKEEPEQFGKQPKEVQFEISRKDLMYKSLKLELYSQVYNLYKRGLNEELIPGATGPEYGLSDEYGDEFGSYENPDGGETIQDAFEYFQQGLTDQAYGILINSGLDPDRADEIMASWDEPEEEMDEDCTTLCDKVDTMQAEIDAWIKSIKQEESVPVQKLEQLINEVLS